MNSAKDVMKACLLAGEIMLKYGAETYRAEETMKRMALAQQMKDVHCFVTPTGIFLSFVTPNQVSEHHTRVIRIENRVIDLNKVTKANDLSRRFVEGKISIERARVELRHIDQQPMTFPMYIQHLAAAIASGSFAVLFGGTLVDFLPAALAGLLVNISLFWFLSTLKVKFVAETLSAFIAGIASFVLVNFLELGESLDWVIIGSLMPLVPGLPLTNAVRDIMAGDLVAGVARGAEALLTSLSIATGIALAISMFLL